MAAPCYPAQVKKFDFTQEEIRDIWDLAKKDYFDKGKEFDDAVNGISKQRGLNPEHVVQAFQSPKVIRLIGRDLFKTLSRRRQALIEARSLVEGFDRPKFVKAVDAAYNLPRSALTWGHGGVFPVTHMGQYIFIPSRWGTFFKTAGRAWSYIGKSGEARYEAATQRHLADPYYDVARQASKSVDLGTATVGILKNMKGWSGRGFNTLKLARLDLFKKEFTRAISEADRVDLESRAPISDARWKELVEIAKPIMDRVDAATGDVHMGKTATAIMTKAFFAPKLLPARFKSAIVDPVRAAKTFANWSEASAGERQAAKMVAKNQVQTVASYAALMAINQAILTASGSDDEVNWSDPTSSDWLAFKVAGFSIRPPNALIETLRLIGNVITPYAASNKTLRGESPTTRAGHNIADYLLYKLHPTIRLGAEVSSGEDTFRRRLPFEGIRQHLTGERVKASESKPPVSAAEYALQKGPIPFGGAAREFYQMFRDEGMDHQTAKGWLRTAAVFAVESQGIPIHESHKKEDEVTVDSVDSETPSND